MMERDKRTFSGMVAYTRRYRDDGTVKLFLRSMDGRLRGQLVVAKEAAANITPSASYTIEESGAVSYFSEKSDD